jgi:hypothetical protein
VINIINYGPDGTNTAIDHINFGLFYRELADEQKTVVTRKEHLLLSESMIKEALRIYTKIFGFDNPRTLPYSTELSTTRRLLSEM